MKKCKLCGTDIDDKYEYCIQCINKVKETNTMQEVVKVLSQCNWNLGTMTKQQRLYYLFLISEKYGDNRENIRKKIFEYFSKDLDKDLKQLKQIKEEQEK